MAKEQDPVLTELEKIMLSYTHTFFKGLFPGEPNW